MYMTSYTLYVMSFHVKESSFASSSQTVRDRQASMITISGQMFDIVWSDDDSAKRHAMTQSCEVSCVTSWVPKPRTFRESPWGFNPPGGVYGCWHGCAQSGRAAQETWRGPGHASNLWSQAAWDWDETCLWKIDVEKPSFVDVFCEGYYGFSTFLVCLPW